MLLLSFTVRAGLQALQLRLDELLRAGRRVVVVGDLNIAPAHVDVCGATPADFNTQRQDRAWLRRLMTRGSLPGPAAVAAGAAGVSAGPAVGGPAGCQQQPRGGACGFAGRVGAGPGPGAGDDTVVGEAAGGAGMWSGAGVAAYEESRHGLEQLGGDAGWDDRAGLEGDAFEGEEGLEGEARGGGWLQREVQGRGVRDGEEHEEEEDEVRVPFHDTFRAFHPNR